MDVIRPQGRISGRVRLHRVIPGNVRTSWTTVQGHRLPGRWDPLTSYKKNTILYDWATVVGELLRGAPDGKPYKIGGMYIEFDNSGVAVSPPVVTRDGNRDYYAALTNPRDYLRVPLTAAILSSTDDSLFPGGNQITFFAQTQGVTGENGLAFSDVAGSRVIGAALVTYPNFADATQDLVFSRFYFAEADQMVKLVGPEVGIEWPVVLE